MSKSPFSATRIGRVDWVAVAIHLGDPLRKEFPSLSPCHQCGELAQMVMRDVDRNIPWLYCHSCQWSGLVFDRLVTSYGAQALADVLKESVSYVESYQRWRSNANAGWRNLESRSASLRRRSACLADLREEVSAYGASLDEMLERKMVFLEGKAEETRIVAPMFRLPGLWAANLGWDGSLSESTMATAALDQDPIDIGIGWLGGLLEGPAWQPVFLVVGLPLATRIQCELRRTEIDPPNLGVLAPGTVPESLKRSGLLRDPIVLASTWQEAVRAASGIDARAYVVNPYDRFTRAWCLDVQRQSRHWKSLQEANLGKLPYAVARAMALDSEAGVMTAMVDGKVYHRHGNELFQGEMRVADAFLEVDAARVSRSEKRKMEYEATLCYRDRRIPVRGSELRFRQRTWAMINKAVTDEGLDPPYFIGNKKRLRTGEFWLACLAMSRPRTLPFEDEYGWHPSYQGFVLPDGLLPLTGANDAEVRYRGVEVEAVPDMPTRKIMIDVLREMLVHVWSPFYGKRYVGPKVAIRKDRIDFLLRMGVRLARIKKGFSWRHRSNWKSWPYFDRRTYGPDLWTGKHYVVRKVRIRVERPIVIEAAGTGYLWYLMQSIVRERAYIRAARNPREYFHGYVEERIDDLIGKLTIPLRRPPHQTPSPVDRVG